MNSVRVRPARNGAMKTCALGRLERLDSGRGETDGAIRRWGLAP